MKNNRKLTDYIRNWKFNSLFVKTLGQLCLLVMVPLCGIIGLSYFVYNNMREEEIRKLSADITNDIAVKWERIKDECGQEFSFFSFDNEVELFIYDFNLEEKYYDSANIRKLIKFPTLTHGYVSNVLVYSFNSNFIIDKNGIANLERYLDKEVVDEVLQLNQEKGILVTQLNEGKQQGLTFFWRFGENKKKALFLMHLSVSELLKYMNFQESGDFYIIYDDTILLTNQVELIGESSESIKKDSEYYYSSSWEMERDGIVIHTFLEKTQMQSALGVIGRVMVLFVHIMFLVTMGLAVWISNKLYRPFDEIIHLIRKNDNILNQGEGFEGKNELEYILRSIEKKSYFDEDISREMVRRLELLKKAQAIALQSQINPHFINNTLETISYMAIAKLGRKNEVSEMVKALAEMLKDSLGNTEVLIPFREEAKHCERYLKIQRIRYQNKFDVIWDIDPLTYDCKIIRIVLQPLVENAIYHGIKHLSGEGEIRIVARCVGREIWIEVIDNGLGMTEEKKEELKKRMSQDMIQESNHIGLTNVYQRLKLYYGEECELKIQSRMGMGTSIFLNIPLQTEK